MTKRGGPAPYHQGNWDWRASGNFCFGGSGSGLLIFSALLMVVPLQPEFYLLAGLAFMGAGLGLVWLEIGRKLRAMNVFLQPRMSWMTRESYVAVLAFGFGLAAAWFRSPMLITLTAISGVLFLYCQARILNASKGIPAWREPLLMPLVIITGLSEGASLFLLVTYAIGEGTFTHIAIVLMVLLALRALAWRRYRQRAAVAMPEAAHQVLRQLGAPFLIWGHALPLLLLLGYFLSGYALPVLVLAASVLALVAGWGVKFTIVTRAAYTQGFAIVHRPVRGAAGSGGKGAKPGWPS